jgi:hypothetical protein
LVSLQIPEILETQIPQEPENIPEANEATLPTNDPEEIETQNPRNNVLDRIKEDFLQEKNEVFTRRTPLVGLTYQEKLQEIIQLLQVDCRGKQRDQQIKTLETCYYLGQMKEAHKEDRRQTRNTQNLLKKSLGP